VIDWPKSWALAVVDCWPKLSAAQSFAGCFPAADELTTAGLL
jgi:hypothetical protein